MHKATIVIPLLAGLTFACTPEDLQMLPDGEPDGEIRVSASIQADIADVTGVELRLTPAPSCLSGSPQPEGLSPYTYAVDVTTMIHSDGSKFGSPTELTTLLAEHTFRPVVSGCYDVVAAPLGADGAPHLACYPTFVTIELGEQASSVVDLEIQCGPVPRDELDVKNNNAIPFIDSITAEPMVSACAATMVCATARDGDHDALIFEWPQPAGIVEGSERSPWPTIVRHVVNPDDSVTQCIAVQAREAGSYDIGVTVYDAYRNSVPGLPPIKIETWTGVDSHVSDSVTIDATLGCEGTGRSAVILLTLDNGELGMDSTHAGKLIGNTVEWVSSVESSGSKVLVVLDDNHHGEDSHDGEFVRDRIAEAGYSVDYMVEPPEGLDFAMLGDYQAVWFVNPGYEVDNPVTHTALLRFRNTGGGLVLQGDDIARFRGAPELMEPLTYLSWFDNGASACGYLTDNNQGEAYTVRFEVPTSDPHPIATSLEQYSFPYGNDIDLTRPLGKGERVLAWAEFETETCIVRTPAIVALDPDDLLGFE